jgi:hypothetical protein
MMRNEWRAYWNKSVRKMSVRCHTSIIMLSYELHELLYCHMLPPEVSPFWHCLFTSRHGCQHCRLQLNKLTHMTGNLMKIKYLFVRRNFAVFNGLYMKQEYGKEGKHRLQNFCGQISREAWFQASVAVSMRYSLFWGVTQRRLAVWYRLSGTTYRSHTCTEISNHYEGVHWQVQEREGISHMPRPSLPTWFDHMNVIRWVVQR